MKIFYHSFSFLFVWFLWFDGWWMKGLSWLWYLFPYLRDQYLKWSWYWNQAPLYVTASANDWTRKRLNGFFDISLRYIHIKIFPLNFKVIFFSKKKYFLCMLVLAQKTGQKKDWLDSKRLNWSCLKYNKIQQCLKYNKIQKIQSYKVPQIQEYNSDEKVSISRISWPENSFVNQRSAGGKVQLKIAFWSSDVFLLFFYKRLHYLKSHFSCNN